MEFKRKYQCLVSIHIWLYIIHISICPSHLAYLFEGNRLLLFACPCACIMSSQFWKLFQFHHLEGNVWVDTWMPFIDQNQKPVQGHKDSLVTKAPREKSIMSSWSVHTHPPQKRCVPIWERFCIDFDLQIRKQTHGRVHVASSGTGVWALFFLRWLCISSGSDQVGEE